jgi:hypothetical protein
MIEKFMELFDPTKVKEPIHILGCGAIGSTLAIMLTRCGLTNITLWDFDSVQSHNLANQQFVYKHIGQAKNVSLGLMMLEINPRIDIKMAGRYIDEELHGYVFLAVDKIKVRQDFVKANMYNDSIKAVFDYRMRVTDAQHYGCNWTIANERKILLSTMDFTQEEADLATPVNGCGLTESIMPTIQSVVSVGVGNFINHMNGKPLLRLIMVNPFDMVIV